MSTNDFTDREKTLMSLAWQCFEGEPKLDYKKLAGLAGFTNPASASNAWARIKKKLYAQAAAVVGNTDVWTTPVKARATPGKKRGRKAVSGDEDDEETPAKKVRSGRGKFAVEMPVDTDDNDDNDEDDKCDLVKTERHEEDNEDFL